MVLAAAWLLWDGAGVQPAAASAAVAAAQATGTPATASTAAPAAVRAPPLSGQPAGRQSAGPGGHVLAARTPPPALPRPNTGAARQVDAGYRPARLGLQAAQPPDVEPPPDAN